MCFTLEWLENLLIWIIVIGATIGVLKLLIPWVFSFLGIPVGPLPQIVNIIVFAIVAVAVIVFVFDLLGCLWGHARLHY